MGGLGTEEDDIVLYRKVMTMANLLMMPHSKLEGSEDSLSVNGELIELVSKQAPSSCALIWLHAQVFPSLSC